MFDTYTFLIFIGARSGSKGLKNKNIIDFSGHPLMSWSIQAARQSKYVDRVLVSTDGSQIADIAKKYGADVPFLRPAALAQDHTTIYEVIRHGVEWIEKHEKRIYDYVVLLLPTSPLRTAMHIDEAIEHYFKSRKTQQDTLVSVKKMPENIGWLMKKHTPDYVDFCFEASRAVHQRQELPSYFMPNGAIYIAPTEVIKKETFYTKTTLYYVMDEEVSIDIDTLKDLKKALTIYRGGQSLF